MNQRARMMQNFSRAATDYDNHAQFQHVETARVLDAALMIFPETARIADIGCGTGYFAEMAKAKRPEWNILGLDVASGMCELARRRCRTIQADAVALPLADNSCDALVSSLCLQWVSELPTAFVEIARVLRPGGRAVIASLGEKSLKELRAAAKETEVTLGLLPMRPAEDYQRAIKAAGLAVTMFKQDIAADHYANLFELLDSMRKIGAGNPAGSSGLQGAGRWKKMQTRYETQRTEKGLPATWDRLFMILHKPL